VISFFLENLRKWPKNRRAYVDKIFNDCENVAIDSSSSLVQERFPAHSEKPYSTGLEPL
jgi:hypothetical protein